MVPSEEDWEVHGVVVSEVQAGAVVGEMSELGNGTNVNKVKEAFVPSGETSWQSVMITTAPCGVPLCKWAS